MNLQTIPFVLGLVAVGSFLAAAVLYYLLKKTWPLGVWLKNRIFSQTKDSSAVFSTATSMSPESDLPVTNVSAPVSAAMFAKRVDPTSRAGSTLAKLFDSKEKRSESSPALRPRPSLPPLPSLARLNRVEEPRSAGTALESVMVQIFEDYLKEISSFQKQLFDATSVAEVLNKTCRSLSGLSKKARVVYLEYQGAQRALMVGSRSSPEIFAGTQPKMFLPLGQTGKSVTAEELRSVITNLTGDAELQQLLRDSCLIEAKNLGSSSDSQWAAQASWRVFHFTFVASFRAPSRCKKTRVVSVESSQTSSKFL